VDAGLNANYTWRPGDKTGVFARKSYLFGLSGKHPLSPGSNFGIELLLYGRIPGTRFSKLFKKIFEK